MVTLAKGFPTTRPAILSILDPSWTLGSVCFKGLTVALSTLLLATVTQDGSVGLKPELQLLNRQVETLKKDPSSPLPDFSPTK